MMSKKYGPLIKMALFPFFSFVGKLQQKLYMQEAVQNLETVGLGAAKALTAGPRQVILS